MNNKIKFIVPIWIKNIYRRLRYRVLTDEEKAVCRWYSDKGEKKRYEYCINKNDVVFDVGGYKGDFSDKVYKKYGCSIYIFEPVYTFFEQISNRFFDCPNIRTYNIALSNRNTKSFITHEENGSKLLFDESNISGEKCTVVNIIDFLNDNNIQKIKLLKLNIEGGEYDLLEELIKCDWIKNIEYLQIQFHDNVDESKKRMENIWVMLNNTHELMWAYRPYVWESWRIKR